MNIKHLAQGRRSAKYCNSTFLAWSSVHEYIPVVKMAIATGHAMQAFNDLHYSNTCRFIGVA